MLIRAPMKVSLFSLLFLLAYLPLFAQPAPCGDDPAMTPTCREACVICDIDGFTGRNNSAVQGQGFDNFCTTQFNNFNYIAFVPGTTDLEIAVDVSNCDLNVPWAGLEIGIFESFDCDNFRPISMCDTDVQEGETTIFTNNEPLVIGQYYYLVMDGSGGSICDWTFRVVSGSTTLAALTTSGDISGPVLSCPDRATRFTVSNTEAAAALFYWTIDGERETATTREIDLFFPTDGTYEVCVAAANVCDEAPPVCTTIRVKSPGSLRIDTVLCEGQVLEVGGDNLSTAGTYDYAIPLPSGCDSLITVDIAVLAQSRESIDINLCVGEAFFIGDTPYATTGIFLDTIMTVAACDSIVTLDLFMIECEIRGSTGFHPPVCRGEANGRLTFSVENGTPPFTYDWSNILEPTIAGNGTTNLLANNEIAGVPEGTYEINVRDNFGNDVVFFQEVTESPELTAAALATDIGAFQLSCFDGSDGRATATAGGGVPPYAFSWSDGQAGLAASGLAAGNYVVSITDANGCERTAATELIAPPALDLTAVYTDPNCDGLETGIVEVTALAGGTAPYRIAFNGGAPDTVRRFAALSPGAYSLRVSDANGCETDTTQTLTPPQIPVIFPWEPIITQLGCEVPLLTRTNGVDLIAVRWLGPAGTLDCDTCLQPSALPLDNADYQLTITSVDDCTATDSLTVVVQKLRDVFSPTAFSPNGDGINDFFSLGLGKAATGVALLRVFDRWGGLVFEGQNLPPNEARKGWDGRIDGEPAAPGVFVWTAEIAYLDGVVLPLRGQVVLLK